MSPADVLLVTAAMMQIIAAARSSLSNETTVSLQETTMEPSVPGECTVAQDVASQDLWQSCNERAARFTLLGNRVVAFPSRICESDENYTGKFKCSVQNIKNAEESILLNSHSLVACDQRKPLQCLLTLELVAASEVTTVELKAVPMPLQSELRGLNNVTRLRLINMSNDSRLLSYSALAMLPSLQRLDVSGGALQLEACEECWKPLEQLEMLELHKVELLALPERAFFNLSHLKNLSLIDNQIETIDENAFEGLSSLEYLSLKKNNLKKLPSGLFWPTLKLRQLWLHCNRIQNFPQLGHLKHLEEILATNRNEIALSLNNDTFTGLGALRKLKLESCRIASVPESLLHGCSALVELSLRGNWLTELPAQFLASQSSLRSLDLAHNRLHTLLNMSALQTPNLTERGVFDSLTALENLDLSFNKLTHLYPQTFKGLTNITKLSLAHNLLQQFLFDNARYHMRLLQFVDYSYNKLPALKTEDLVLLTRGVVDVRHNEISCVTSYVNYTPSQLRFLLDNNPFDCDCYISDFLEVRRNQTIASQFDVGSAQCSAPLAQSGKLLVEVQPSQLMCSLPPADCPGNFACELRPLTDTLDLNCERVTHTMANPWKYGARGVRLRLHAALADVGSLPASVRHVDLSGLQLTAPPAASTRNLNLTVDLSNNSLTSAPLALLEANCKVLLAANPLACSCGDREWLDALLRRRERVPDLGAVRCRGGQPLSAVDVNALCATRDAIVVGLGAAAITVLLLLIVFRFRFEMRLLLSRFAPFDFLLPAVDAGMVQKKYDAFVSFSHHDEAFVREVLVPALEGGRRPLRLCLHYRDWEVGDLIPEQIDRSVRDSWRTIVVLSENFVRSVWGRHEFRAAHGMERVIVLVLGDALRAMDADHELRAYKKTHTCLMASHPLVWDRIRDAVYRSKCSKLVAPEKHEKKTEVGGLNVVMHNGQLFNVAQ